LKALRRLRAAVTALERDDGAGLLPTDQAFWQELKRIGQRIDRLICPETPELAEDGEGDALPSAHAVGDDVNTELSDVWRRGLADIWGS